jgi:hypothetical protein
MNLYLQSRRDEQWRELGMKQIFPSPGLGPVEIEDNKETRQPNSGPGVPCERRERRKKKGED